MKYLLVAAAVLFTLSGVPASGEADELVVELTIEHSRFAPHRLVVPVGVTVTFEVRNLDPIAHELIIGSRRVQLLHERGTGHHHGDVPGEISIPAGAERATTYTFRREGMTLLGCHLPGHYAYGMRGVIQVTP